MVDTLLRGHILYPDGPRQGEILVRDGIIIDVSDHGHFEMDGSNIIEGLIIPGLLDSHTHLGDHLARGDIPHDLGEVVLPGGLKHRFLNGSSRSDLVRSVGNSLREIRPGVSTVIDYREGGNAGMDILEEARTGTSINLIPLVRTTGSEDPGSLLDRAKGFGLPSLSTDGIADLRELASRRGSIFSVHASEIFREDVDIITSLDPDQVIHMIKGTPSDWRALSDVDIPVAICPRSNLSYSLQVPLLEMMEADLKLSLGTDNSISVRQDMFREMEAVWILLRKGRMAGERAAEMVFHMASGMMIRDTSLINMISPGRKWWEDGWPGKGDPSHLSVIKYPKSDKWTADPYSFLVRFCTQSDVLYTGP